MDTRTQIDLWRRFFRPAELASWVMLAVGLVLPVFLPMDAEEYMHVILVGSLMVAYNIFFFHWLVPNHGSHRVVPLAYWAALPLLPPPSTCWSTTAFTHTCST